MLTRQMRPTLVPRAADLQRYLQWEGKMELIEVITDYQDLFLDMTSEYVGREKKSE